MSELSFADLDPASVESSVLTAYEDIAETTLYPGDPVRLFLESLAYVIAVQNSVINLAGRQNLLRYAEKGHLEEVARMVGTERLGRACARCVQRFRLAAPLAFGVLIPAGTRVTTADTRMAFATLAVAVIPAGKTSVETAVQAEQPGTAGNGLITGQINRIIDPVAYVTITENTSTSAGGADVEDDARLRERAQLAPEAFSCAGPRGAYRYQAMSAHPDIADAAVWSPRPGTVDVRPIMQGGEMPTEEILDLVRRRLSAEDVRPLTDTVIVAAPEPVEYALAVSWALQRDNEALSAGIQSKVTAAVERYRLWQRSAPGRDINPTRLISLMEQAGARRVIAGFEFTTLAPRQIARELSVSVQFLGIEDE